MKESIRKQFIDMRRSITEERRREAASQLLDKLKKMTEGYKNILSQIISKSSISNKLQKKL